MPRDQIDFSRRAHLSEWMDEPCSYEEFRDCLRDLQRVNRVVRAYPPTLAWLQQFAEPRQSALHIVDVGCGGGDMLRQIEAWARRRNLAVRLTGIDLNPHAVRAAREFTGAESRIEWVTGNAFSYDPAARVDLIISSLFTHHLPDTEIVRFLAWMEQRALRGWFINDLHRQPVPYHSFKLLAWLMHWHPFVRHDGPVSILRSFSPADWQAYCAAAGLNMSDVRMDEVRPARLCVSRVK